MGLLSALLYISVLGTLLYLLPLIYCSLKLGRKALLWSSLLASFALTGLILVLGGLSVLSAQSLIIPLLVTAGLCFITGSKPADFVYRCLAAAVVIIPVVLYINSAVLHNPEVKKLLVAQVELWLTQNQIELSAASIYDTAVLMVGRIGGAVVFIFLFLNAWLGGFWFASLRYRNFVKTIISAADAVKKKRSDPEAENPVSDFGTPQAEELISLARKINEEQHEDRQAMYPLDLRNFKVPVHLIWVLLSSWTGILLSLKIGIPEFVSFAVWNCTIGISFCYLFQGLAVVYTRLSLIPAASAARLGFTVILVLLVVGGAVSLVVSILLMLIGTLETWIHLRPVKGV